MLTILLGPFLALFPKRWRDALPAALSPQWRIATILSGLLESGVALFAMLEWYSYSMMTWVSHGMDSATNGNMPREANEQEIGFAAVTIFAMHPLTWAIGYAAVEGTVRLLSAAFSETSMGILPLYLVDKVLAKISGRHDTNVATIASARGHVSSYGDSIKQKIRMATLPEVPDELFARRNEAEEILEVRACRTKEEWVPPKVVRMADAYYRLEETKQGNSTRPYVYILRKLSAGVPGRTVLLYQPAIAPVEVNS